MSYHATYTHNLDVSVDDAWVVLGDFGSLLSWVVGGDVGWIKLSGEGIGMLRDFYLPSVGEVQHRLDELDHEKHRLTYSLTGGKPLGMDSYAVTATLTATGNISCTVTWDGALVPEEGADGEAMAGNLAAAYEDLSVRLNARLLEG
jgi:hypothetical protein